jgi:hypothetical protein
MFVVVRVFNQLGNEPSHDLKCVYRQLFERGQQFVNVARRFVSVHRTAPTIRLRPLSDEALDL